MRDIKFISIADKIKVTKLVDNGSTVTINVLPTANYINGIELTDEIYGLAVVPFSAITILSSTSLKFVKPSSHVSSDYTKIDFLFFTNTLTDTNNARLIFNPSERVVSSEGVQKLIQQIVKIILSSAGSNRYALAEGGDLLRSLGSVDNSSDVSYFIASIEDAVERTKQYIVEQQLGQNVPSDERLLSLFVDNYTQTADGYLEVNLSLKTLAGRNVTIPLSI